MEDDGQSYRFQQQVLTLPRNVEDFKKQMSDAYLELFEEIQMRIGDPIHSSNTRHLFRRLYSISEIWSTELYVLTADMVRDTWNFLGTHITANRPNKDRPFQQPAVNPSVRAIGNRHWGRTRIKNIISPDINPDDYLFVELVRDIDVSTGMPGCVRPVFVFGPDKTRTRFDDLIPTYEYYVCNKDLEIKERLYMGSAKPNFYYIGNVERHDPNPVRTDNNETYKVAQCTYTDKSLQDALDARRLLGDLWMHLKVMS